MRHASRWGGGCEEPELTAEPLAATAESLITYGVNNDTCGSSCDSGEVATCTTVCVTPLTDGQICSPYPCQSNSRCLSGSSCVRVSAGGTWPNGVWRCVAQPDGLTWGAPCEEPPFSGTGALCPTDTYCKDVFHCAGTQIAQSDTVCVHYQTQGRQCDGNAGGIGCALCAPQTTCVASSDVDLYPFAVPDMDGWCRKSCSTAADCPCEDDGTTQEHTCSGGYCYECVSEDAFGDKPGCGGHYKCCGSGEICAGYSPGNHLGTCCLDERESCSANAECCGVLDHVCFDGQCQDCREEAESCANDGQCCDDLSCDNGVCREIRLAGKDCIVPSTNCEGETVCPSGDCVGPGPGEEVCDGKDNDCDGLVDEGYVSTSCPIQDNEDVGCQDGPEIDGHYECIDGDEVCVATPGIDFCTWAGQDVDSESCGVPGSTPCDEDPFCAPNHECAGPPNQEECVPNDGCTYAGQFPKCWMPEDTGTCMDPN